MGKFTFEISEDFIFQLERLANVDNYAPAMLNEAAPILQESVKRELSGVMSGESTGDLLKSVKYKKASKTKFGGYYLQVRPTGTSTRAGGGYLRKGKRAGRKKVAGGIRDPIRNMEKAVYLEYGTSQQTPRPWVTRALKNAEPAVLQKMKEVFEREVNKT